MGFLKNLFARKEAPINSYADFWTWFQEHEKAFYEIVKNQKNIEKEFFSQLSPKLAELKEGFLFLVGMTNDQTVELIFTADGYIRNVVFVEELVAAAPNINGWKFIALKPALDVEDVNIRMSGQTFNANNIFFYSNDIPEYPDEVNLCIIHQDMDDDNRQVIISGIYIFLEHYLGELDFINIIDDIGVVSRSEAEKELVPISKLKDYLIWRQKEFVEKYQGTRFNTDEDDYSGMEATLETDQTLIAVINSKLLQWDRKASHPWMAVLTIPYNGKDNNGMPENNDFEKLNMIEEEVLSYLKDKDGYLNVGRQTGMNERTVFFACKDFRYPSKVFYEIQLKYGNNYDIDFDVFKDKYWQSLERFREY